MRIAYVSDERFPSTHTDTQQVAMTVAGLAAAGADVELVVPRYLYGPWATGQEASLRRYYGVDNGFRVRLVTTAPPQWRAVVKPLHAAAALRLLAPARPDVVYTRNPPAVLGALAAGHRVVLESYRVIDQRYPALMRLAGRLSRRPGFLGVVTHSSLSADSFLRSGFPTEKVRVVHNGWDGARMERVLAQDEARRMCALPLDRRLALYAGHLNANKGIESLAALAARTPDVVHVWVGADNAGGTDHARACAEAAGARNVVLPGWVEPSALGPYLFAADVLVIPPAGAPLRRHGNTVLPMKTFAYMASGRAILAPDLPDTREVLRSGRNALLVPADDAGAAAAGLRALLADPAQADALGAAAREDSRDYTWAARARRILSFIGERLNAGEG